MPRDSNESGNGRISQRRTWRVVFLTVALPTGLAFVLADCGGTPASLRTSDVPCFSPDAWPMDNTSYLALTDTDELGTLLLTGMTPAQFSEDSQDFVFGNGPHGPVYRFDPNSETFELVDGAIWDALDTAAVFCFDTSGNRSTEIGIRRTLDGGVLVFDGETIPVAGGNAILTSSPASGTPVTAVLSVDGRPQNLIVLINPIAEPSSDGQRYHQVFSEVDGSPIGPALRLGVGGITSKPSGCWTKDDRFVTYSESTVESGIVNICVVTIEDELPSREEE